VWLGAINVTGFKNALESCHTVFLVELRTLRKVGDTVKILQSASLDPPSRD